MTEGRVSLMTSRQHARRGDGHSQRFLTLSDNLSSSLAFEGSRARPLNLLADCRSAAGPPPS